MTCYLSNERTSARTAKVSRFSLVQHSLARTGTRNHACTSMCSTTCVLPCFVSSSTRHVREWDRPPFTSGSEGAIQRLLKEFHIMSSVSEENSFRLPQDKPSTSASRLTIRNSAPDSAANGQKCSSQESVMFALQVRETHPASCVVNTTSCQFKRCDEGHI